MLNSWSRGTGLDEPRARVVMSPLDKEEEALTQRENLHKLNQD